MSIQNPNETILPFDIELDKCRYTFLDPPTFIGECKALLFLSIKIALALIFETSPQSILVMFIGRLPTEDTAKLLAGVGIGRAFSVVIGFSLAWGATAALWTLIPQAVGSHHQNSRELVAIYAQRSFILSMSSCLLLTPLLFFGGNFMILIGQNPELMEITNNYCRAVIPYMYFLTILCICQRVGQSYNLNTELLFVVLLPFIFYIPMNYLFVYWLDFGWIGVCYALDLNMFLNLCLTVTLLYYKGYGYIFVPLPMSIVCTRKGLCEYLAITIPGAVQGCISIWVGEIIVLFSGYILSDTNVAMSATSIIFQVFFICIYVIKGVSYALNIRLGKYIGMASVAKSKRVINVSLVLMLPLIFIMVLIVTVFHSIIFEIFTLDDAITKVIDGNILLLDVQIILFGFYAILCSIYISMGLQKYMAYAMIFGNWMVGIGLQLIAFYVFGAIQFTLYGVQSVWFCSAFGYFCDVVILLFCYYYWLSIQQAMNSSKKRIMRNVKHYGSFSCETNSLNIGELIPPTLISSETHFNHE